jgi:hypothetical protein
VSWDADLSCAACGCDGGNAWNYTSNTNPMVNAILADAGYDGPSAWWTHLNGMTGEESRPFLDLIIQGLEADPDRFRAMNPPNGWGSYDNLLATLHEMRAAAGAGHDTTWSASG